jgi:hypothetical protein
LSSAAPHSARPASLLLASVLFGTIAIMMSAM